MSKNLSWRGLIIAILIIIALLYLIPSTPGGAPQWWTGSDILPQEKVHLGLDLQGGMHLMLEVEVLAAVEHDLERFVDEIKETLRGEIRYGLLERDGLRGIKVMIYREEDKAPFIEKIESYFREFDIKETGATEKGINFDLILTDEAKKEIIAEANDQVRQTINNRIDQFGVAEADIRPMPGNRIQIQLPGIDDPERAKDLILQVAVLEFKIVDDENDPNGSVPAGDERLYEIIRNKETGAETKRPILVKKRTLLTGEFITDAGITTNNQYRQPWVSMTFNKQGAKKFERITGENIGKNLAIILDGVVKSYPTIRVKITDGKPVIQGTFTMEEARDLSLVLRSGSLTAPIKFIEERTVGPSLGQDSINKGFNSMMVGGLIVIIFMAIYYKLSGLIADIALMLNVIFIMAGLAAVGATLTLPGIAGIILTIGMAVDANVLIFERIREELKLGKTPRTAIESGFSKAIITILDANVTTFIAALVLFQFGTGPVKGFAVTLSIGIVASFITAVFITRLIFDFFYVRLNWKKISI